MEAPVVWGRGEAVARLRKALLTLVDGEHSMCQVASERGVFCRGFGRWNASEFDRRWRSAIGRSTHLSRAQMEEFANLWQLSEQHRQRVSLACDAASNVHGGCRGWDEFSNSDLSRFCADVLGLSVQVVETDNSYVSPVSKKTIRLPFLPSSRFAGEARAVGEARLKRRVAEVASSRMPEL
jgi:hypothetical protein